MSLYDDIDTDKKTENVAGWASGIKFMQQTHLQPKKSLLKPKREGGKKGGGTQMAAVVDFKSKANQGEGEEGVPISNVPFILPFSVSTKKSRKGNSFLSVDPEWQFENEYDPFYPNEYDKALKDLRDRRDKEAEEEEAKRKVDDEMSEGMEKDKTGGVAIAPPASLNLDYEDDMSTTLMDNLGRAPNTSLIKPRGRGGSNYGSVGVGAGSGAFAAAKIMAKYGYKEGQGLGKKEQGMSTALQVQKTSHRTGRIIHEKDLPKEGIVNLLGTPPNLAMSYLDDEEFESEPPQYIKDEMSSQEIESTVGGGEIVDDFGAAEQLKHPSVVLLLSNMVGPGDVDDDLEPEVKEECQKYGEVSTVVVFKMPDVDVEDSIRIFVEFVKVESSVQAFMDLNGRYFGGRQVRASFYDPEKFNNFDLTA